MEYAMEYALEIKHLTKDYGNFQLKDISFKVPKGTIMGFIGENGAGKTTTLKLLLNIIQKDSGCIRIFDHETPTKDIDWKQDVGIVFDECHFHDNLRMNEISKIMSYIYKNWKKDMFIEYCKQFQLPQDKIVKEFSRGMKMKLAMAVALSHEAKLLILDEATAGLDPVVRDEILDIFLEFIQDEEHTVLLSSHITSDLEKVADYITFIHEGQVLFSQSKDELLYEYGIAKCTKEQYQEIDASQVLGCRKNSFGIEALIQNKRQFQKKYLGVIVDSVSIEDILLFETRGRKDR